MSPEDIKPEWVEKAAREVYAEWENEYMGDGEWPAWDSDENLARDTARTWARNILAAVLPEAMAEAWEQGRDAGFDTGNEYGQGHEFPVSTDNPYREGAKGGGEG
jgi:hypothetical protein